MQVRVLRLRNLSRRIAYIASELQEAEIKEVGMIGPATVGGIKRQPENNMAPQHGPSRLAVFRTKARMHSHWEHRCPTERTPMNGGFFQHPSERALINWKHVEKCCHSTAVSLCGQVGCSTMWSCPDFIVLDQLPS